MATPAVTAAVRRKLNITWDDEGTAARLEDVVGSVSPRLASLLGMPSDHAFAQEDGAAWGLFLNGCLYEFSDAWDDFESNYASEILSCRLMIMGGADAETQG